jgi:hypothetical protein
LANTPPEDVPLGLIEDEDCSLIGGEKAHQEVEKKVRPYVDAIRDIKGSLPS